LKDIVPEKEVVPQPFNAIKEHLTSIGFSDVSFSREHKNILQHFNTEIKQGDFVGLASESGKGKTTLINLLLGFLEPEQGNISFNGLPAKAAIRQQFWSDIAYVKQQNFLIHDTIARNIVLHEGPYDEAKLADAMKLAGLEPLLRAFAEGAEKIISDNGKDISGGQRQRIAIARALYKDARFIILDEPFNELDEASEQALVLHFKELCDKGYTVMLITHNSSSLSYCNKIIRLHD
jgi:ABC-type bacteriocin/lantibiotic exporter with double-glycine peptidase domain